MTPRRSFIGVVAGHPLFGSRWLQRAVFALLIAVLGFLTLFPERHRAAATLTPTDPANMGLSGALGQLGAINNIFGNQAAVEVALKVARSIHVRDIVIKQLKLQQQLGIDDPVRLHRWLEDRVIIRALRGGIIQFESFGEDAELSRRLVGAFATATQERMAQISRQQTAYKRDVLIQLVHDASDRLARAQSAYDSFRLQNRYVDPELAVTSTGERITSLEEAVRAKETELTAARQFFTDENMTVRQLTSELGSLRRQLSEARATSPMQGNSAGQAIQASTVAERMQRELGIAKVMYESYMRFLEGTAVEDLTSTANVRVLEPPFVDTERQFNKVPLALALALALLWAAIEFYRLRPPVGDRVVVRETYA